MNASTYAYVKGNLSEAHERIQLNDFDEDDMEKVKQKLEDIVEELDENL